MNALKHGLTGAGIALPSEDLAEIERQTEALYRELNPKGEVANILFRRTAFLVCRLDRCQRHDIAMQSNRERHAEAAYTEGRIAQVDVFASKLSQDPTTSVRNLQAMPEGLEFLAYHLGELRTKLADETRDDWGMGDCSDLCDLLGQPTGPSRFNRVLILSESVRGYFANVPAGEWPGLSEPEKIKAARAELLAIIEVELARLKAVYGSLDHAAFERDRVESVDRALFDPSKEAVLARKYEAATERSLYRALRELKQLDEPVVVMEVDDILDDAVDLVMPPPEPVEVPETPKAASRTRGSLASFFQTTLAPSEIEKARPDFPDQGEVSPPSSPSNVRPTSLPGDFWPGSE